MYGYSDPMEVKQNPLFIKCGLCIMTSFQIIGYRRERGVTLHGDLTRISATWSRSTSARHTNNIDPWCDRENDLHQRMVFLPKNILPIMRKTLNPITTEGHAATYMTSTPQTVMVTINKESWEIATVKKSVRRHD